jgi:hypothetical protein
MLRLVCYKEGGSPMTTEMIESDLEMFVKAQRQIDWADYFEVYRGVSEDAIMKGFKEDGMVHWNDLEISLVK